MPRLIHTASEMQAAALELRRQWKRLGLVPTMGALHAGHLSLVEAARRSCDAAVATIFVNPTQFAPHEDFAKYPRTLENDLALLDSAGCDIAFVPAAEEVYPPDFSTYVSPPAVANPLEGKFRPHHFRGVCTVVLKLFNLVPSDVAFFGQKDYQQALVIRHMTRDLNLPLTIDLRPTVREADGLAMSSRNRYLSPEERRQALALSQALGEVQECCRRGNRRAADLSQLLQQRLRSSGIERIDYATVVDAETLGGIELLDRPAVALIACHVGTTRLIDNELLT